MHILSRSMHTLEYSRLEPASKPVTERAKLLVRLWTVVEVSHCQTPGTHVLAHFFTSNAVSFIKWVKIRIFFLFGMQ